MKWYQKFFLGFLIGVVLVAGGSVIAWQMMRYPAAPEAQIIADKEENSSDSLYFPGDEEKPLVIFYPGALVEAASYSGWASQLAAHGYSVAVVKMPFDLAVLGGNRAEQVLANYPHHDYVMGGHSLGGVMASRFAAKQAAIDDQLKGVFFFASYPDEAGSLESSELAVLSLTATNDEVLSQDKFEQSKKFLPTTTEFLEIKGGNHAGFGDYGIQKKDGSATISNKMQEAEIVAMMLSWLKEISG